VWCNTSRPKAPRGNKRFNQPRRNFVFHGRAWPSNPCFCPLPAAKSWVAGPSPAMTRGAVIRPCSIRLFPHEPLDRVSEGSTLPRRPSSCRPRPSQGQAPAGIHDLPLLRQRQVVDTGIRRHDAVGVRAPRGDSIISPQALTVRGPSMPTTTIRIDEDLRARLAVAAMLSAPLHRPADEKCRFTRLAAAAGANVTTLPSSTPIRPCSRAFLCDFPSIAPPPVKPHNWLRNNGEA